MDTSKTLDGIQKTWVAPPFGSALPTLPSLLPSSIRTFETGATRNADDGKLNYEGFLSPLVLRRFAEYMHQHRHQGDGALRSADNWQKGIPRDVYMESAWRHFIAWWTLHRTADPLTPVGRAAQDDALCALLFNTMGYLHETLKRREA